MATAKMLTQLLRGDNIAYTSRPVANFDEVLYSIKHHVTADIRTVFMINCGAIYDIPKHFELEHGGDLRCFILDNHRPIHLKNIYSRHNVVVFDENFQPNDPDFEDDVPSEASEMSSVADESSDDGNSLESSVEEESGDEDSLEGGEEGEEGEEEAEFEVRPRSIKLGWPHVDVGLMPFYSK